MSNPLDSDIHKDVSTFPMYQRLRKTNPYAYYSLNTQKQMQSDLRNYGSLTFFEQDPDNIPDPNEPKHSIDLPKALAEAEHMLDTGSPEFNEGGWACSFFYSMRIETNSANNKPTHLSWSILFCWM